jgi:hypothetical protein
VGSHQKNIKAEDSSRGDNAVCLCAVFSILYEGEPKTGLSLGSVVYHGRCLFYVPRIIGKRMKAVYAASSRRYLS